MEFLKRIKISSKDFYYVDLSKVKDIEKYPFSYRVFLENLLRFQEIETFDNFIKGERNISFNLRVYRLLMQDFTGVPLIADLAALKDFLKEKGRDPKIAQPSLPSHLVIDHSVIVDYFGTSYAYISNVKKEYERNIERYLLIKWAGENLKNFKVVPPGSGIVHQVNLEYLTEVVGIYKRKGKKILVPDTLLGTDSHTPMVSSMGVLGWGVGGIEAEAVILGFPYNMKLPKVFGIQLEGELPSGATATDLVLTITEILRSKQRQGWLVEFYGRGVESLELPDRATISNMAPEYGALTSFFPVDDNTLNYLKITGRKRELIKRVEFYCKENFLFRDLNSVPQYDETIRIDLSEIKPCLAGPRSPHQKVFLFQLKEKVDEYLKDEKPKEELKDGSVVICAITSCTNTSNPNLMLMAGLLAKKAVEKGLSPKPWVKTSFAPGSKVVKEYLERAGLMPYLEALKFHIVGYGCTTCIGNSGPLPKGVKEKIEKENLTTFAVLSGNRNFEGRINPHVKGSFLASPPLVIVFALTGTVLIDLEKEPLGYDPNGKEVFLKDIWPKLDEIKKLKEKFINHKDFKKTYKEIYNGDETWENLEKIKGDLFPWDLKSTYLKKPPFFEKKIEKFPLNKARILAILEDNVTTDHISPAGQILKESPAGKYLMEKGVEESSLHSFGARRGNDEVMVRGTFGNIRLRNLILKGKEGPFTIKFPEREEMFIYDAAMKYREEKIPLVIFAGKNYGMGSSRDWAAKGTYLLGVRAIFAKSFERIHRQNLIGMGVLPLKISDEETIELNLEGSEIISINEEEIKRGEKIRVSVEKENGETEEFYAIPQFESDWEFYVFKNGGIYSLITSKYM